MNDVTNPLLIDPPAITVLMSVYNGEQWLQEAIESVLNQTFRDFEFIIVDDGSTDNSAVIINRMRVLDSRIVTVSKQNTGLSDSLNYGIQKARGEWIARIDADDVCEPRRLEKQFQFAQLNPKLVYIGTGLSIINEVGEKLATHSYPTQHAQLLRNLTKARKFPAHSSAFFRTKAVRSLGGYRTRIKRAEDWDLWLRLSEVGEMAALCESLIKLRQHSRQISHDEGGRRQLFDSKIGLISYWLRRSNVPDPVGADETTFKIFVAWLEDKLVAADIFQFHDRSLSLRTLVRECRKSPLNMTRLARYCIRHPGLVLRVMKERILGDTLTRRLASLWAEQA